MRALEQFQKMLQGGLLLCVLLWAGPSAQAAEQPLIFGILNQQSPKLTAERWNPVLQYLSKKTGVPLRMQMGPTVQDTDAMMGREEFDFVYTNHNYQPEYAHIGYKALARLDGEAVRGVIVTAVTAPISSLQGLAGKRVAFPSRDAFVAYAVPWTVLKQKGITVVPVFTGNHEGSLAQLRAHLVDAAVVMSRALKAYAEREGLSYRVLYETEAFPEQPVVVHPRVPAATVQKIRNALLAMSADSEGRAILEQAKMSGFVAAADADYASMRQIYKLVAE